MQTLATIDYTILIAFFAVLVAIGFSLKRVASKSLENYFLGGRQLPWWLLGVSGMASFLDMTGTMIITSFLFMLGPRGLFIEFRGGAVLVLAIFLLWTGKWHRRSGCMTGAEWMAYRFGDGGGGQAARILRAVSEIIFMIMMLTYLIKGAGLFLSMFMPFSPALCAFIMIGVATVYIMVSGFYGVVFTDLFQSFVILSGVIIVVVMAVMKVTDAESLAAVAGQVTGNADWLSSAPHWHTTMPAGYGAYQSLALFAIFYLVRNVLSGMGEGDDQRFFGARNERECGILTFFWTWLMMFRWPMMIGFAVLGLYLANDMFPDQAVLGQAAALIKEHVPGVAKSQWAQVISGIIHQPGNYAPDLIAGLKALLGEGALSDKLYLLSFEGTVDPERILPAVILKCMAPGVRGLLLVVFLAASLTTFASQINRATAFFTRDIYQRFLRPRARNAEYIYASWCFGAFVVAASMLMAYTVENINDIWGWIIMGLAGGRVIPMALRFYWWRLNGQGYAIGMAAVLVGAGIQRAFAPGMVELHQFLILIGVGILGCVAGTYAFAPADRSTLEHFYRTTRPFGLWGPLRDTLSPEAHAAMRKEHRNDLLALPFTMAWQVSLFLLPMQLVIKTYDAFFVTLVIFAVGLTGMYFLWYRNLPPADAAPKTPETTTRQ